MHVLAPGALGGLERVVQTLAAEQHAAGDDVHVTAVVSRGEGAVAERFLAPLRAAGVGVHRFELPPRSYRRERSELTALCRELRPSIVHTHGYRADLVDGAVAREIGAAAVTTMHGFTGGSMRNRCYEALNRRAARRFDAVVAVSAPLARDLAAAGVRADRLHLVRNAWRRTSPPLARAAARSVLGLPAEGFTIGWAGRLSREKGLDVLIDALTHIAEAGVHVAVLGDGPERHALEHRAARRGVAAQLTWHGFVPGADTLFTALDLFVLSSRTEGTPMVLFEAIASAVPIVATRVGGVPDIVSPSTGVLVDPDQPRALADAIDAVVRDPDGARRRADAARDIMNAGESLGAWVAAYDAAYDAAIRIASSR